MGCVKLEEGEMDIYVALAFTVGTFLGVCVGIFIVGLMNAARKYPSIDCVNSEPF